MNIEEYIYISVWLKPIIPATIKKYCDLREERKIRMDELLIARMPMNSAKWLMPFINPFMFLIEKAPFNGRLLKFVFHK